MFRKLNDPKTSGKTDQVPQKLGKSLIDLQTPQPVLDFLRQADRFTEANGLDPQPNEIEAEITLFAKGLTIDKFIFREYSTPEGQKACDDMAQGRVPQDLLMKAKGQPISLMICDRRGEEYVPERLKSGEGGVIGKIDLSLEFKYDESLPTTTLQIRFHNDQDVKKVIVNLSTRVEDLHDYIVTCAPVNEDYVLMCGYPPEPLNDPSLTIEMLHLLNGTVIQQVLI